MCESDSRLRGGWPSEARSGVTGVAVEAPHPGPSRSPPEAGEGDASSLRSRRHDDLADDLAVLDQAQSLDCLGEREGLVDDRLHLALRDQLHEALEVLV